MGKFPELLGSTSYSAADPRDSIRHDTGKMTPIHDSYVLQMSPGEPFYTTLENRRTASRRLSSRRRHKIPYVVLMNPGKPYDTTLANRRRASQRLSSRRRLRIPNQEKKILGTPCDTNLANRRQALRRQLSPRRYSADERREEL
jgi:hypothetical protein